MVGSFFRLAAAAAFSCLLAGCASAPDEDGLSDAGNQSGSAIETPDMPLECVPYARAHSGVDLHGDAYTWWDQAAGHFDRASTPKLGAVLVLSGYAGPNRAHLAVVSSIVSSREIHVDHANWLDDGAIYLDDPVVDVSADNDWSEVRVWNIKNGAWGARAYPVQGFIGPRRDGARVAANDSGTDSGEDQ